MAEMRFFATALSGKTYMLHGITGYEWTRDISAPCDGMRLTCLWDDVQEEFCRLDAYAGDEKVFTGYVDYQSFSEGRLFLYARSSACLLVDNEAEQLTYKSPCVRSLVLKNALPFGFKSLIKNYFINSDYTVEKGTSCYGAINNFVKAFSGRSVTVSPSNELYIPSGSVKYAPDPDCVLGVKTVINRGEAVSRIDYKTDGEYIHHYKSFSLEDKGVRRTRQMNLSAVPEWQRGSVLSNRLRTASRDYYSAELKVEGLVTAELYSPVVYDGLEGYYVTGLVTRLNGGDVQTKISLSKSVELKEADYVA